MGAADLLPAPEGLSPTPTCPTPPSPPVASEVAPHPLRSSAHQDEPITGLAALVSQLAEMVGKPAAPSAATPPEALSKEAAAEFLGVVVKTIEHLIRTRRLPYAQLGSQRGR